jgi:hypothetical protein
VCEPGNRAHLLCLEMGSLQSAAELEHWLRMNVDAKTDVTLLGRFDGVYFSADESEMQSLVLGGTKGTANGSSPHWYCALDSERQRV